LKGTTDLERDSERLKHNRNVNREKASGVGKTQTPADGEKQDVPWSYEAQLLGKKAAF